MTIHEVHHGTGANIGHVGLALIAEMTRVSGLDDLCRKSTKAKQAYIPDEEILPTICGLMCQGKTDFDRVPAFREDASHTMVEDAPIVVVAVK